MLIAHISRKNNTPNLGIVYNYLCSSTLSLILNRCQDGFRVVSHFVCMSFYFHANIRIYF